MTDQWADVFVRFLFLSGLGILLISALLWTIDAYVTEKSSRRTTLFKTAAKVALGLWFLNTIALTVFGILAEWFSLGKWEIWATYAIALLIGLVTWLLSRKATPKEDRSLLMFALLFLAFIITSGVMVVALITGRY